LKFNTKTRKAEMSAHHTNGIIIRPPLLSDAAAVAELINTSSLSDLGQSTVTTNELLEQWGEPGFDLKADAWVAISAEGKVVGYEELFNRYGHFNLQGDGYVHPHYQRYGIGTALLRKLEARARQHVQLASPEMRACLRNGISLQDTAGGCLHQNEGYQAIRYFYWMRIQMESQLEAPQLPQDIHLSTYHAGIGPRPVFEALEEAFQDHWGQSPWNFARWKQHTFSEEFFDPGLIFIAFDGDKIAGAAICRLRFEHGWISTIGVRRPWRRQGLGHALLLTAFNEFYRRGEKIVALSVDAESPTGATRLYERAGMNVYQEFALYEKELRPGKPFSED
jgi:mycothiol synthase